MLMENGKWRRENEPLVTDQIDDHVYDQVYDQMKMGK
jgi:hypothetical protein